jgi:hypothetical protein
VGIGHEAIWCKPRTSIPDEGHRKYPYLLRNLPIERPDHVWCGDITYVPMPGGHAYLCAALSAFDKEPTLENSNVVLAAVEGKALKNAAVEIAMPARSSMMDTIRRQQLAILKPALKAALKGKIADMESEATALTNSYSKQASELGVDVTILAGPLVGRINAAVNEAQSHLERAKSWTSASNARSAIDLCLR